MNYMEVLAEVQKIRALVEAKDYTAAHDYEDDLRDRVLMSVASGEHTHTQCVVMAHAALETSKIIFPRRYE